MEYVTQGYEPKRALQFFEELSQIPRGSRNEKAAAEYVYGFAVRNGLNARIDELYNVVVKKPGSEGFENAPTVLLQAHLDMVCEKNIATKHDFEKDPLQLFVENGILKAHGTTLGADNGLGCAYMMALLDADDLVHPPLECVFTSMEEVGLLGAIGLDTSDLCSKYMMNLDAGPEGVVVASCGGGLPVHLRRGLEWESTNECAVRLSIRGLAGGHSAVLIHKELGNSIKIMGRILHEIRKVMPVQLASVCGGDKMNAIPRECDVTLTVDSAFRTDLMRIAEREAAAIAAELTDSDSGFTLSFEETEAKIKLTQRCSDDIIDLLYLIRNGVHTMSTEIPELVITSTNLGSVVVGDKYVELITFIRSSVNSLRDALCEEIRYQAERCGFSIETEPAFPGWQFEKKSLLREIFVRVYREQTGKEMKVIATHGGLECAIFKGKMPELDIIGFGPYYTGGHTPEEALDLASYERTWNLLLGTLSALAEATT